MNKEEIISSTQQGESDGSRNSNPGVLKIQIEIEDGDCPYGGSLLYKITESLEAIDSRFKGRTIRLSYENSYEKKNPGNTMSPRLPLIR